MYIGSVHFALGGRVTVLATGRPCYFGQSLIEHISCNLSMRNF